MPNISSKPEVVISRHCVSPTATLALSADKVNPTASPTPVPTVTTPGEL